MDETPKTLDTSETTQIGKVATIQQGKYLSKQDIAGAYCSTSSVPVHGANGIIGWTSEPMYEHGVPLVTCRGSNSGMVLWADGPLWVSNNAMAIVAHDQDNDAMYRILSNDPPYDVVSGSAQPQITRRDLSLRRIIWPTTGVRQDLAETLGALDDQVERLRRTNETLEAMARAVFRDWFVDFDPVRRRAGGETDPVAIMGGLTDDPARAARLATLFPDTLDEDGLPEGWEVGTLADVARQVTDKVKPDEIDDSVPYIGLEHMPRRSVALDTWETVAKVTSAKTRFTRDHVLFGKLRPYFHKVGVGPVDGVCSTDIIVLEPIRTDGLPFLLACVSDDVFVEYATRTSTGTKMPRASWKTLKNYLVVQPSSETLEAYSEFAGPLIEQVMANVHRARILADLRDLLLPKLISGEVRLTESA